MITGGGMLGANHPVVKALYICRCSDQIMGRNLGFFIYFFGTVCVSESIFYKLFTDHSVRLWHRTARNRQQARDMEGSSYSMPGCPGEFQDTKFTVVDNQP